jgi:hypothetical protein
VTDTGPSRSQLPERLGQALAEAFARRSPQGSLRWNYEVAFALLEAEFGAGEPDPLGPSDASGLVAGGSGTSGSPGGAGARRVADRLGMSRLRAWVEGRSAAVATETTQRALREGLGRGGVSQAVEALRFLARRVDELEAAGARRRTPVLAAEQLIVGEPMAPWVAPVAELLVSVGGSAEVLHAECGAGELVAELGRRGIAAAGADPRGFLAWEAAARGVAVDVEHAQPRLTRAAPGAFGGIVLSGVIDRSPVEDLVQLVADAVDRLAPDGLLVVVSADPDTATARWPAVALDLLPGRPLHAETWHLLLERAGLSEVVALVPTAATAGYALSARRGA